MKNKIILTTVISLAIFCIFGKAQADTMVHLDIEGPNGAIYNQNISVAPCDSDHHGAMQITAYCAILQSGVPSVWDWTWPPGAFVTSINNIAGYTSKDAGNNDVYHYWNWSVNGIDGTTGLNEYELQSNDSILLNFIDPDSSTVNQGGLPLEIAPIFSVGKANSFLASNQKSDSSFGDMLYTDWVAISVGASSGNTSFFSSLKNFLQNNIFNSSVVTDNERHALALMALGINPYDGTSVNYIKKITDSFDGTQIGDPTLVNDDIFGLIVLSKAGYMQNDEIILKDINYILSKQENNGSWSGSADMTSAGIQALHIYSNVSGIANAIAKAENYLIQNQNQNDGGFGNNFSTSWALQALSLDPSLSNATSKADAYLANNQQNDGGMEDLTSDASNRIWSTAYAIPAILHKSFSDSVQSFSKYIPPVPDPTASAPIEENIITVQKEIIIPPISAKIAGNIKIKQPPKIAIFKNKSIKPVSENINLSASAADASWFVT